MYQDACDMTLALDSTASQVWLVNFVLKLHPARIATLLWFCYRREDFLHADASPGCSANRVSAILLELLLLTGSVNEAVHA